MDYATESANEHDSTFLCLSRDFQYIVFFPFPTFKCIYTNGLSLHLSAENQVPLGTTAAVTPTRRRARARMCYPAP